MPEARPKITCFISAQRTRSCVWKNCHNRKTSGTILRTRQILNLGLQNISAKSHLCFRNLRYPKLLPQIRQMKKQNREFKSLISQLILTLLRTKNRIQNLQCNQLKAEQMSSTLRAKLPVQALSYLPKRRTGSKFQEALKSITSTKVGPKLTYSR